MSSFADIGSISRLFQIFKILGENKEFCEEIDEVDGSIWEVKKINVHFFGRRIIERYWEFDFHV